jgi:subtilisin family serine protease
MLMGKSSHGKHCKPSARRTRGRWGIAVACALALLVLTAWGVVRYAGKTAPEPAEPAASRQNVGETLVDAPSQQEGAASPGDQAESQVTSGGSTLLPLEPEAPQASSPAQSPAQDVVSAQQDTAAQDGQSLPAAPDEGYSYLPADLSDQVVEDEGMPAHMAGTVLVEVPEGTTRDALRTMLANVACVDVSYASDRDLELGLVELPVAADVALSDAIAQLEHTPGIDGAQPNYVYTTCAVAPRESPSEEGAPAEPSDEAAPAAETEAEPGTETETAPDFAADLAAEPEADPAPDPAPALTAQSVYDDYPINDADAIGFETDEGYWQLVSVRAFEAWRLLGYDRTHATNPVSVAVIDTGANVNELDLTDRIRATYNSAADISNASFGASNSTSDVTDVSGHGSHVAGIIAATANNGVGVAGVAYNAGLVIIKAGSGSFSTKALVYAYKWLLGREPGDSQTRAQRYNVRVINMSLGADNADVATWQRDTGLYEQISAAKAAGILTVCAAGNSGSSGAYKHAPGDYADVLQVIALGHSAPSSAHAANDAAGAYYTARATYSNYNESGVTARSTYSKDIAAPGGWGRYDADGAYAGDFIWSTYKWDQDYNTPYFSYGNDVTSDMAGTSMACPVVSGVAALVSAAALQRGVVLDADEVRSVLENSAFDLGASGWDSEYGFGEVNSAAAVEATLGPRVAGDGVMRVGATSAFEVLVDGTPVPGWQWGTSDSSVATIDASGTLMARAAGSVSVWASDGSQRTSMIVQVVEPQIIVADADDPGDPDAAGSTSDPDAAPHVGSVADASCSVQGEGCASYVWLWSVEDAEGGTLASDGLVSIGEKSGVLTTRASALAQPQAITLVAACASNPSIQVRQTVTVEPRATIVAPSKLFVGLGTRISISNSSDGWQLSLNEGAANATLTADASSPNTWILTTDIPEGGNPSPQTLTLTATRADQTLTHELAVIVPELLGPSWLAYGDIATYALSDYPDAGCTYSWSATGPSPFGSLWTVNLPVYELAENPSFYLNSQTSLVVERDTLSSALYSYSSSGTASIRVTVRDELGRGIELSLNKVQLLTNNLSWIGATVSFPLLPKLADGTPYAPYSGEEIEPDVQVNVGETVLAPLADYEVSYRNNVNAGTCTVTISAAKNGVYTGSLSTSFRITPANIAEASVSSVGTQTSTGSQLRPTAPAPTLGGRTLVEGRDYSVSYGANNAPGTGTITYTGKGNYTGSKTTSFSIVAAEGGAGGGSGTTSGVAMYRMYNPNSGEHFYTASAVERTSLVASGWHYEGVGWTAPRSSNTPVYRLYSGTDHHYTTSTSERDWLRSVGWSYEGIGWYSDDARGVALWRLYNPNVDPTATRNNSGSHHYTTSAAERDHLARVGWRREDVGWYGLAS